MKPENAAYRKDYEIRYAAHCQIAPFITTHHYAKGCSNTFVHGFSLHRENQLVGAAAWLPPTKVCAQSVRSEWRAVLSLSRLAILPGEPTNAASLLIGECIRRIRRDSRWKSLVTFADTRLKHTGQIYRATNWTYVGETEPSPCWLDKNGKQVAKQSTKTRTNAKMIELGYIYAGSFSKHKYVFHLIPLDESPGRE